MSISHLVSAIKMDNKNLRAIDARQKSVMGTGDIKITASVWSAISFWNASRILTKKGRELIVQEENIVNEMETNQSLVHRTINRDAWVKLLLNAIIKKEGSLDFMDGESLNWPKIKQPTFIYGITISRITHIIMAHRETLKQWNQQQTKLKTSQKQISRIQTVTMVDVERAAAEEAAEEAKYSIAAHPSPQETIDVPESWEDL